MNYEVVEKKGESTQIALREVEEGRFDVTIDGKTVHVDAVKSSPSVYTVIEDGKQFEVVIDEKGAHGFDVLAGGRIFHLEAFDERSKLLASAGSAAASGPQRIEAEMPGKVVKVSHTVGDGVAEGEGVMILEAMKMENEIPSPIDGVVAEIGVAEGDTVEAGAHLFTIEPTKE